ncbi:MAG: valine--tRNA ligase [Saprospiraceae bacterium]|nr:valine--tRNA ligase [Saprospiraceae bacterium]
MEIKKRYNPQETEDKWYSYWREHGYFHSEPDDREPYSIVIPPPNVTGVLHMGHMLNNTIQDVLARKARLDGKNVCWVPGTDHASIATEAKVVRMLREKGIKKSDLTREEFLEYAWKWKEEYGGKILKQLEKLGTSCDWERTAFTMDETRSDSVIKVFVDLYKKGKLYRKKRMVNWDSEAKTVLSNEEVIYKEETTNLWYVKYKIKEEDDYLTIATTRPETIMGDTAVAVNPNDARYNHLEGKHVIVPIVNREAPIIFDDYVDVEFGTGALKITPAHDVNDYEIGLRHDLEVIDVLNPDGTMSPEAEVYIGEDKLIARKKVVKDLKEAGLIDKIENLTHNVGRSERTDVIVEPRLSLQWYVDMKQLAEPALKAVETDEVEFFPKNQKNLYRHWMENIRDWCISRQLWWGHRIPAWYYKDEVFVAETAEEALVEARDRFNDPSFSMDDLLQDEDVLDTWFSSWLWPISVFNGFQSRRELDYYYPTSVLVTGWDIIFLWVARMIMAGYEWEEKRPFKHVYFTGMVRDKQRRKMSKSLGNSPDATQLLSEYGADGVRFGMLMSSPAGGDLLFDVKLCEQGRNFCNKIWNALRLVNGWESSEEAISSKDRLACNWITERFNQVIATTEKNFNEYKLSDVLMDLYSLVWSDYCSWFLEMLKPAKGEKISAVAKDHAIAVMEQICVILHPFMPFITEEVWHIIKDRKEGDDCMISIYPEAKSFNADLLNKIEKAKGMISSIRDIRNKQGIKNSEKLVLHAQPSEIMSACFEQAGFEDVIMKLANLESFTIHKEKVDGVSFISGADKLILEVGDAIDAEEEIGKLEKELEYQEGFVTSVKKKLDNERFVNNAPEAVVNNERKKLADGLKRIELIKETLASLS